MKTKKQRLKLTKTLVCLFAAVQVAHAQDCKTNAELDVVPGKYLTAAQYPWPAARAAYFNKMTTVADKAMAKQNLEQAEKIEQQSHAGFNLTGGNWESYYSTEGYQYLGNTKLGQYTFQSALYEYFCVKGKQVRNSEYSSVLRMYVNKLELTTLDRFLSNPFGSSFGSYDFGLQYSDWKNHKPADVNAKLISLFSYLACNNQSLISAINSGDNYFQDVADDEIKPNNRNNYIYRYWFVKKNNGPLLVPVSRKEYLQSLLDYYEREKIYFPKLVAQMKADHDSGLKYYNTWEADVADKAASVKRALSEHNDEWLSAQAIINPGEDNSQTYNAKLPEQTNYHHFWKFYDKEKNEQALYKYNMDYFKTSPQGAAKPQLITVAFRYVSIPSSIRMLNNFTQKIDFGALRKLLE